MGEYRQFLVNTLALEAKSDGMPRLSDMRKLSGLSLSESTRARLDSMYDAKGTSGRSAGRLPQRLIGRK